MKKRLITLLMTFIIMALIVPAQAFAAPKVLKTTSYGNVIKSGYTLYVVGGEGLYKVHLNKNGSLKSKKLLRARQVYGTFKPYTCMKKYGQYIYANEVNSGTTATLVRININNGKRKYLAYTPENGSVPFAIYKNKLYYSYYSWGRNRDMYAVMNLDGSRPRGTTVKPSVRTWASTTKGYYSSIRQSGKTITTYLKTPRGLYKLGSHTSPF